MLMLLKNMFLLVACTVFINRVHSMSGENGGCNSDSPRTVAPAVALEARREAERRQLILAATAADLAALRDLAPSWDDVVYSRPEEGGTILHLVANFFNNLTHSARYDTTFARCTPAAAGFIIGILRQRIGVDEQVVAAFVNAPGLLGNRALHCAARAGDVGLCAFLLSLPGIQVAVRNFDGMQGKTPLYVAWEKAISADTTPAHRARIVAVFRLFHRCNCLLVDDIDAIPAQFIQACCMTSGH